MLQRNMLCVVLDAGLSTQFSSNVFYAFRVQN